MQAPVYYEPGKFTGRATGAAVAGGRFVAVTGNLTEHDVPAIAHAEAGSSPVLGGTVHDAADGDVVTVYVARGTVLAVEAGGAITAGAEVEVGANGTAVAADAGDTVGYALADAAQGDLARVVLT